MATLAAVSFRPESIGGVGPSPAPGQIDYRLVRRYTVDQFRRGRLSRREVCDAHPELLRVARNVGRASEQECPICDEAPLVFVSFAFGSGLPSSGKVVDTRRELARLARRHDESTCYVVEVCPGCSWNHLVRTFPVGGGSRHWMEPGPASR